MPTTRFCATPGCITPPVWGAWCVPCASTPNTLEEHDMTCDICDHPMDPADTSRDYPQTGGQPRLVHRRCNALAAQR